MPYVKILMAPMLWALKVKQKYQRSVYKNIKMNT